MITTQLHKEMGKKYEKWIGKVGPQQKKKRNKFDDMEF